MFAMTSLEMTSLKMTSLKTIVAVALISAVTATPVFAQAAISEPGAFAFYHPNADVLNGGARFPQAAPSSPYQSYAAAPDVVVPRHVQPHHRIHRGH
jgi:hypothetical protein